MQDFERSDDRDFEKPISNGPNARPRHEPIGHTGQGLSDDSSKNVEITPGDEDEIAAKFLGKYHKPTHPRRRRS